MSKWILVLLFLAQVEDSFAADFSTSDLIRQCKSFISILDEPRTQPPGRISEGTECLGYIQAAAASVINTHDFYQKTFPGLRYPIADQATANRYLEILTTVGPDICFPAHITPHIIALIVVKRAEAFPAKMTEPPLLFFTNSLWDAYPCTKTQ